MPLTRTMRIAACALFLCSWFAGCNAPGDVPQPTRAAGEQPDASEIATTYRSLRAMTQEPVLVDTALAMLCRGLTTADIQRAREASGPHALTAVRIHMSDAAMEAFGRPGTKYPVGSVIVKEKSAHPQGPGHDGVGGMIKRAPGYDPAHGDWEYFYFEDPAAIESGRIASCIACHRGAAARDFVFGHWAHKTSGR